MSYNTMNEWDETTDETDEEFMARIRAENRGMATVSSPVDEEEAKMQMEISRQKEEGCTVATEAETTGEIIDSPIY